MFGFKASKVLWFFLLLLVAFMLVAAAITSSVIEGEFSVNTTWDTFLAFFGGLGSLAALIGGLALVAIAFAATYLFSKAYRHVLAGIVTIIALVLGGYLLYTQVHWEDIKFDLGPMAALLIFTLAVTVASLAILGTSAAIRQQRATTTTTTTAP